MRASCCCYDKPSQQAYYTHDDFCFHNKQFLKWKIGQIYKKNTFRTLAISIIIIYICRVRNGCFGNGCFGLCFCILL